MQRKPTGRKAAGARPARRRPSARGKVKGSRPTRRLKTAGAVDQIDFEIRWGGGLQAELVLLKDNERPMDVDQRVGAGRVTASYAAQAAHTHVIGWDLYSAGNTLQSLRARARKNGGDVETIGETAQAQQRWRASGEL